MHCAHLGCPNGSTGRTSTICWERPGYSPQEITVAVCDDHAVVVAQVIRSAPQGVVHAG